MKDRRTAIRRILLRVRDIWLGLSLALLVLLALEGTLSLAYVIRDRIEAGRPSPAPDHRIRADAHAETPWANEYYREFAEVAANRWVPYVYWRREPHQGRYIHIDANGLRRTWTRDEGLSGRADHLTIFMFGGSTMWGVGARDDFTIPSLLAKQLDARGIAAKVVNLGEAGYVSTQEVISLIRQLHEGNIPNLVIFYDGVNDVYSAWQQQVAGLPQNEYNRRREFNLSQPDRYRFLRKLFLRRAVDELSMMRLTRNMLRRLGVATQPANAAVHPASASGTADSAALCREVLAIYQSNVRTVRALAESYGFKVLFYWQPTIFDKTRLTAYEESERRSVASLQPFYEKVHELVRQGGLASLYDGVFHDASGVFSEVQQPVFVDWCHVCEWGNGILAARMATDAAELLAAQG